MSGKRGARGGPSKKRKLNPNARSDSADPQPSGSTQRARFHSFDGHQATNDERRGSSKPKLPEQPVDPADASSEGRRFNEKSHLLTLLPEKVWTLVFEKLDDHPKVLENLSNSAALFRDILRPKQVLFLFPKVAEIMINYYHQKSPEFVKKRKSEKCSSCGKYGFTRWYSDILTLRLACRNWCTSIDNYFQDSARHLQIEQNPSGNTDPRGDWIQNYFRVVNLANTEKFMQHFEITHGAEEQVERNPFLSREVLVKQVQYIVHLDTHSEKWYQLLEMIEKYGPHVWYFTFDCTGTNMAKEQDFYLQLLDLLERMPNLKVLKVMVDDFEVFMKPYQSRGVLKNTPFPTLPSLQLVEAKNLPYLTFGELLRRNGHITMLKVTKRSPAYLEEPLPNLKQLSLSYSLTVQDLKNLEDHLLQFPLKKLVLHLGIWELQRVFDLLSSKWSETLTHLTLELPFSTGKVWNKKNMPDEFSTCKLNLAHLSYLKVGMRAYHNLDFLLPVKNTLKFLDITVTNKCDIWKNLASKAEAKQEIKFWSCSPHTRGTNVWSLFPQLKQIKYHEHGFGSLHASRADWAKYVKKRV